MLTTTAGGATTVSCEDFGSMRSTVAVAVATGATTAAASS